jgi:hypothetical protein
MLRKYPLLSYFPYCAILNVVGLQEQLTVVR